MKDEWGSSWKMPREGGHYYDMVGHPLADAELKMQYWEKALATVGENVLVISEADDLATQISTMVSPSLYREMVSPYHKKLFDFIRSKAKNPVHIFYHTCGAVKELIPCLIDEGVDVLNPV